jgi:cytochrome c oxidase subunit 2
MWADSLVLAQLQLFPDLASKEGGQIDALYWFINVVCILMTVLIFLAIAFFAYKYRRRPNVEPTQIEGSTKLELTWSILPFLVMLIMFAWGAQLYYAAQQPPRNAMEVFVTGKQWMWKVQYPNGGTEINELHVPMNQPVKLTMASEDVIHSFSIPAFRVRHDVVPGHYDSLWFTPSKPGRYRLFCTEYCGLLHSGGTGGSLAQQGETLFAQYGCSTCHLTDQQGRCPVLKGLYNKPVQLANGQTVLADDAYLRESILEPNAKIAAGFEPNIMPNFNGQISEQNVIQLIAYIKSLAPSQPASQQGSQQAPVVIAPRAQGNNRTGAAQQR